MAEALFSLCNYSQKASVNLEQIYCREDTHVPTLAIPVRLDLSLLHKNMKYVLLNGEFSLQVDFGKVLSKTTVFSYRDVAKNDIEEHLSVEFEIDESKLHSIESNRKEGVVLRVNFKFNIGMYDEIIVAHDERNQPIIKRFIDKHYTTDSNNYLEIKISQSQWVNNILPKLGYKQYRLIELPSFNDVIPESYSKSVKELEEAIKYFKMCDWDKVVSHCRSALDPIKNELSNIKGMIESDSEFKWFKTLNEKTYDWLDICLRSTISVTSKTHHAPSTGHFTRNEAQIILMVTTSLVAYAGQLKS